MQRKTSTVLVSFIKNITMLLFILLLVFFVLLLDFYFGDGNFSFCSLPCFPARSLQPEAEASRLKEELHLG